MLTFEEALDETDTPTPVEDDQTPVEDVATDADTATETDTETDTADDAATDVVEPVTVQESPTVAAARVLELAAGTADQLVADAKAEAASLVSTAQAEADAILEASRTEANQAAAELARTKVEQTAELDLERVMTLSGLADEKAALEAQIATLRQLQSDHRTQLHDHLTEQLSLLEAAVPDLPTAVAG